MTRMTLKQFRDKVNALMLELNEDKSKPYNIGIFVFDVTKMTGEHFGMGCPGCMALAVNEAVISGEIKHSNSRLHIPNLLDEIKNAN